MATRTYPAVAFRALSHLGDTPWFAIFPDLPGCFPAAESLEDLAAAAVEAAALHLGDTAWRSLPTPTPYAEVDASWVARSAGIAAEEASAEAVLLVPVPVSSKATKVTVTLDAGLLERIDRAASDFSGGRSGLLAEAARRLLAERGSAA